MGVFLVRLCSGYLRNARAAEGLEKDELGGASRTPQTPGDDKNSL
jgi:hypothetical protein